MDFGIRQLAKKDKSEFIESIKDNDKQNILKIILRKKIELYQEGIKLTSIDDIKENIELLINDKKCNLRDRQGIYDTKHSIAGPLESPSSPKLDLKMQCAASR
jgi:hypothetical protein